MGLIESFLGYAKSLIVIESKVSRLQSDVGDMANTLEVLTGKVATLSERLAKIEGKFEAYERMAQRVEKSRKQIGVPDTE
jgi:chromosome segregation ATPase